jgi:hypothetical protein
MQPVGPGLTQSSGWSGWASSSPAAGLIGWSGWGLSFPPTDDPGTAEQTTPRAPPLPGGWADGERDGQAGEGYAVTSWSPSYVAKSAKSFTFSVASGRPAVRQHAAIHMSFVGRGRPRW